KSDFFAVLTERMQIEKAIVGGGGIDFEIARVHDYPKGRVTGEGNAINQAVRHPNGVDREWPYFEALTRTNLVEIGIIEQSVLVEFVFNVCKRKLGSPDWNIQLREYPRQGSDVVFVAMREHDCAHTMPVFRQV